MLTSAVETIRQSLVLRLSEARSETDGVFGILKPEALYERPIAERHRIIFYVGHLEAFDRNLLQNALNLRVFNPAYDKLFAFGIDPIDGSVPNDQPGDWPSLSEVFAYRSRIREEIDAALVEANETDELVELLNIAIEHRLMHAETLEYMLHQLPYGLKVRPDSEALIGKGTRVTPSMVGIPAGEVTLGLKRNGGTFGWDNEFPRHVVAVPAFSIDKFKVTNREFLQFVGEGGYGQRALWKEADWEWKTRAAIAHPVFWVIKDGSFRYRSMFEEISLPMDAPVYASHAEASAYARWVGKDLPTEAEWQRAAEGAGAPQSTRALWDPPAIGLEPCRQSEFGVEGLVGGGWEWTSTAFSPFEGFEPHPAYPGYSANFFDGEHYVMKGGSTRTAACMLRETFRNWFQAHYQYAYAGFRCVTR